jgi:SAM-dependent methyltransferase
MTAPNQTDASGYLMAGQQSELDRLRYQATVWEPAGERLLARLGAGAGLRVLDAGCGALGWLRILAHWVGPSGRVVGTDVSDQLLAAAATLTDEGVANLELVKDDFFASGLPDGAFDLVHLRYQLAPIGRAPEQVAIALRLLRPGGWLVLEDPETGSWREHPLGPAAARLRALIRESFARAGGDFDAGRRLPEYLRAAGITPSIQAETLALPPGHPYLQLPIQFATSLRPRLLSLVGVDELDHLIEAARTEFAHPERWGTSFTLIQAWGRKPA